MTNNSFFCLNDLWFCFKRCRQGSSFSGIRRHQKQKPLPIFGKILMEMRRLIPYSFALALMGTGLKSVAQEQPTHSAASIRMMMNKLNTLSKVLYVAAHPDDENTRLISWLANEKYAQTAYLSLTRGDGGQNLIGTEKGALMGLLRTQELLEARRIDGGQQFFTRAVDFGYSKNPEETFEFWEKEEILSDVVWTIRKFQPDIIITRFPPTSRAGHGHHTASAILAAEAFEIAANPKAFPAQLKDVDVWKTKSLYHNTSTWWYKDLPEKAGNSDEYAVADIGTYNPILGMSYGEIASESRSQHQSQGFGSARQRGSRIEYMQYLDGEKTGKDLFSKTDVSWNRVKQGKTIGESVSKIIANFKDEAPWESIPALVEVRKAISTMPNNPFKMDKLQEVDQLILACSGIWLEARADDYRYAFGAPIHLEVMAINRSPQQVEVVKIMLGQHSVDSVAGLLPENELKTWKATMNAPNESSQPYWLKAPFEGMFQVDDHTLRGVPENAAAIRATYVLKMGDQEFMVHQPVVYEWVDRASGEHYSPLSIVPPVTGHIDGKVLIFPDGEARDVEVKLTAHKDSVTGTLSPVLPAGWKSSDPINFDLPGKGGSARYTFKIQPPAKADNQVLKLAIDVTGEGAYHNDLIEIDYDHIQRQTLIPPAESKIIRMEIQTAATNIGYIMGAGDDVPVNLEKIGYNVHILDAEGLDTVKLERFDCVITGIRAYNTIKSLKFRQKYLMQYVMEGGTLVIQYNTNRGLVTEDLGPYPFKLGRGRVTNERADANITDPEHPVLNYPNKITQADFEGWVQERGLYFAETWEDKYRTAISWKDKGEEKGLEGALLTASYGNGHFVYTGISFFRQLPAGVPGAYRLFANIIAYGRGGK